MPRVKTGIYGSPVAYSVSPLIFNDYIWKALGLDGQGYNYGSYECPSTDNPESAWRSNMRKPDHMGSSITMPIKLSVMPYLDELTPEAKAVGSVNTTKLYERDGKLVHIGTNLDIKAILNSLRQSLTGIASPFPSSVPNRFRLGCAAGLVIGAGGATRAAIYALHQMQLSPIYVLNRDSGETQAIIEQFPDIDLRALTSVEQAKAEIKGLERQSVKLCLGVGCIPSAEPVTESEKMVYDVARAIFSYPYESPETIHADNGECFSLPKKAIFFDMAYKPVMTLLRVMAEELGWQTGSGVDIVAENCFEQAEFWLGLSVSAADRKVIRQAVRDRQ